MAAEEMLDLLRKYRNREVLDPKTGEVQTLPASVITAIAKFLKDNGIDRPVRPGSTIDRLASALPDMESVVQFPGLKR